MPIKPVLIPDKSFESNAIDKSQEVRKFKDVELQAHIDRAIASLPPEAHGVIVGYATRDGARLAFVGRKEFNSGRLDWTVALSTPWKDAPASLEAEAAVRFTW